jgi:hypothetical protein
MNVPVCHPEQRMREGARHDMEETEREFGVKKSSGELLSTETGRSSGASSPFPNMVRGVLR